MSMKKWLPLFVITLLIFSLVGHVSAATTRTYEKTFVLDEAQLGVSFTIENYETTYSVKMIMPNKHEVAGTVNKKETNQSVVYRTTFNLTNAPKGTYTFVMNTPKATFFNLFMSVDYYKDIQNHWARHAIQSLTEQGIVEGISNRVFKPNDPVTGEQLLKMVALILTTENPSGKRTWSSNYRWNVKDEVLRSQLGFEEYDFSAITMKNWAESYKAPMQALGVIDARDDAALKEGFTRKKVALLLSNVMKLTEKLDPSYNVKYTDVSGLSREYQEAIRLTSSFSIFAGYSDGSFQPDKVVTRAEAAVLISKLQQFYNKVVQKAQL